jgi:ribosomal protein L37AE/L43A
MSMNQVQFQKGLSMAEFMERYGTEAKCHAALVASRWPEGFRCPCCGDERHSTFVREERQHWQCHRCQRQSTVTAGEVLNPPAPSSGRRGRTRQSDATNLLARLCLYEDDVLRCTFNPYAPFTNNIAEQAVRMCKVKQKVSGCFRTLNGASAFCIIHSYLATLHKQKFNLYHSLVQALQGNVPQPQLRVRAE